MRNRVKFAGRAAEISDLSWFPPPGQVQEPPQPRVVIPEQRGCNFHPAVPSIAQRRAQQSTLQKSHHDLKKTPKEAAGCARPSCRELNWQFRGRGPCCVGLEESGGVSITCPPVWLTIIFVGFATQFHPLQINAEMAPFLQGTAQDTPNQRCETKTHFDSDEQREFLFIFDF